MSLQGIPGGGFNKPKLAEETPAPPPGGENVGGAKQKTHMDKINESHKALHKSRSEQREQMVKFMVTKAANAAHTMKNAMLKPIKPERVAEHNFHKISANAIKNVSKKIAMRNAKRSNAEGNSSAEDMKLRNASMQASMSMKSSHLDTDEMEMDTDTDSSGSGELSGGSKDQIDIIMMLKSMHAQQNHPDLEKMADEVKDVPISNEQKVKVVSGMLNSGIKPGNEESNKLINLVNSDDFNKLSDKTKDVLFNLIEGTTPKKTDYQGFDRTILDMTNKQMSGPLAGLNLKSKADLQANSLTSVNQLSAKTDDVKTDITIVRNGKVNQPTKLVSDKLLGSSIEFKISPKISTDTLKTQLDDSFNKLFLASNNEEIGVNPSELKNIVQSGIDKVLANFKDISNKVNTSVNFRISLITNSSGQVETSGVMIKLDKTRLSVD